MSFIDGPRRFVVRHTPGFEERLMHQDNPVVLRRMLLRRLSPDQRNIATQAANLAEEAFRGLPLREEERKIVPVVHSYRVAVRYAQSNAAPKKDSGTYVAVALLHDIKEDTTMDHARIATLGTTVDKGVGMLTRKGEGPQFDSEYFNGITDKQVGYIKAADRIENMEVFLRMGIDKVFGKRKVVRNSMWRNYTEAMHYIVPLAVGNKYAEKGLQSVLRRTLQKLYSINYQFPQ